MYWCIGALVYTVYGLYVYRLFPIKLYFCDSVCIINKVLKLGRKKTKLFYGKILTSVEAAYTEPSDHTNKRIFRVKF